jgi:hypothetical protein
MSEEREPYQTNGLLTKEQVAEIAGITPKSVLYHIHAGHLPAQKQRTPKEAGQRGGYFRWLVRPEDAAYFVSRLHAGEIGKRGGNYGGGRPAGKTKRVSEDFTHLYLPCDADHRRWLAERLSPAERLAVLNWAVRLKLKDSERFREILGY